MYEGVSFIKFIRQLIIFCGVGVLNSLFCLALILILSEWLGIYYVAANLIGYLCAMILGFTLHRRVTFQAHNHKIKKQIAMFLSVSVIAYLSQLAVLVFLVENINVNDAITQMISIVLYVIISFIGNKFITFPSTRPSDG